MSDQNVSPPAKPAKPPRSAMERAIVWGVIGLGLLVIGVEAKAHLSHSASLAKLRATLDETLNKDEGMTKKHVDVVLGTWIPESRKLTVNDTAMNASRVDVYSYPAILRSRKLYIYYGIPGKTAKQAEAEVMDVLEAEAETAAQAHAKLPAPDPNAKPSEHSLERAPGQGGPGGPGSGTGGGNGGGRRRRSAEGSPNADGAETPADAATPDTPAAPADDVKPTDAAKPDEAKPADEAPAQAAESK